MREGDGGTEGDGAEREAGENPCSVDQRRSPVQYSMAKQRVQHENCASHCNGVFSHLSPLDPVYFPAPQAGKCTGAQGLRCENCILIP